MNFDKLLAGWSFRTSTPAYEVGEELTAFVTHLDGGTPVVRIGDTIIRLSDTDGRDGALVERRATFRVTEFDPQTNEGRGELLAVLDDVQ